MDHALKLRGVASANPAHSSHLPVAPYPGAAVRATTQIPLARTHGVGGQLLSYLQSEELLYFEQLYRVLPEPGIYTATPSRPFTFTLGAFRVPAKQVLVILDYNFDIYRFFGVSPTDYVPIEENRLSTQVGWDINVSGQRPGSTSYDIVPSDPSAQEEAYSPPSLLAPPQQWQFDQVRAQQNQGHAGPALSMMPQRHHRNGLVMVNNQYVVKTNTTLNVTCSVLNAIPIPIAFFEANVMGILMPQSTYDAYQAANLATGEPQVPVTPGSEP